MRRSCEKILFLIAKAAVLILSLLLLLEIKIELKEGGGVA